MSSQRLSKPKDDKEELPSISLDHRALIADRIELQVNSSSSIPSTSYSEGNYNTYSHGCLLSLSKRKQKKCYMLDDLAGIFFKISGGASKMSYSFFFENLRELKNRWAKNCLFGKKKLIVLGNESGYFLTIYGTHFIVSGSIF